MISAHTLGWKMKKKKGSIHPFLIILAILFFPYVLIGGIIYYFIKFLKFILVGGKTKTNYQAYLQSEHWKSFRKEQLKTRGYRCQQCGRKYNLRVHHKIYERLGHELPEDVLVVCNKCHAKIHRK